MNTTTISAMDLRKEPGNYLDRVDLRGETFVIERSGKAKAALLPIREYEDIQRRKQAAREKFGQMTEELQQAFVGVNLREAETEIENGMKEARAANKTL